MKSIEREFTNQVIGAQPALMRFAMKLTSNSSDANDLVQDTTLKALRDERSFAPSSNFGGWIMTIMRNTFLNNCRSSKRSRACYSVVDAAELSQLDASHSSPTPDSVYSAAQISQIIAGLPDDLRIPFTMQIEGYKYAEIADKTGLDIHVVKASIQSARRRLRSQLSER